MKTFRRFKSQLGQGMTEYIIIVALVAIGAITVYKYFGQTVNATTALAAQGLAGGNTANSRGNATNAANKASTGGQNAKTMGNFETTQ
jgi:hypothetical protein